MLNLSNLPHRHAWNLAWPLMLSNLTTPLMGLADTAMLGHLGSSLYLAAAAIGANVLTFSLWVFGFLRMGTTSLTGRALGAQQARQIQQLLYRGLIMGAALGLALIIVQFFLLPHILGLMTPDTTLQELARRYCLIRLTAAPAVLMTYAAMGWFIGLQQSRKPLLITLTINCVNLVLDWLFILLFGWGSDGAALASAIAEYVGLALVLVLVVQELRKYPADSQQRRSCRLFSGWLPLIRINSDLFVRTAALLSVFTFFTAQGAHLGANVVAANAILLQLLLLTSHALDGYAHAAESTVARAMGARNLQSFLSSCLAAGVASVGLAILLSLALLLIEPILVPLLTDIAPLQQLVHEHYPWLILLPLVSVWSYLFDGIFIGAGRTSSLRNWMLAAVVLVFVPSWWFTQPLNNHGLWLSFTLFNLARGFSLGAVLGSRLRAQTWLA